MARGKQHGDCASTRKSDWFYNLPRYLSIVHVKLVALELRPSYGILVLDLLRSYDGEIHDETGRFGRPMDALV